MILGYFQTEGAFQRPYIDLILQFPVADNRQLEVSFLIDTGSDRTLLSPTEGARLREQLGVDILDLPFGSPVGGIGGQTETRMIDATLDIGEQSISTTLSLVEPPPGQFPTMPSLLGRDTLPTRPLHGIPRGQPATLGRIGNRTHQLRSEATAMRTTKTKLITADELLALYGKGVRGELIRGELCETMPSGGRHGEAVMRAGFFLNGFIMPRRLARLAGSDSGVLLERNPDTVRYLLAF